MTEDLIKDLEKDQPSGFHNRLLQELKSDVKRSRAWRSRMYSYWDDNAAVYRGERCPDNEDKNNARRDKPVKMIVPNTFAQAQTMVSFLFLLFNQNQDFFEVNPTGDEDSGTKRRDTQSVLSRDLRKNMWNTTLYQQLTHIAVFGEGNLSCEWTRQIARVKFAPQPQVVNFNQQDVVMRQGSQWQDVVKFEGNLIKPISPYRFFPDTRYPLSELSKHKTFCAWEEEYSMSDLRDMASTGDVAGVEMIRPLPENWHNDRGGETRTIADFNVRTAGAGSGSGKKEGPVLVTKVKKWLVPNQFKIDGTTVLGPEDFPVLYDCWYANDNRIIRCEMAEEWHQQYGVTCAQFTPDMHETLSGLSLAGLIFRLQDVISWFINAHVKEVNRTIQNRRVINQDVVEPKSLDGEGDIYLRKNFGRRSVAEAVMQLPISDVTSGHMSDSQIITQILQMVTGVNDGMQGQYSQGRRDATQSRNVAAGAAGRMKLHGHLIWDQGLNPLAQMMLSNSRQSLSPEMFSRIIGRMVDPTTGADISQQRFADFAGTPEDVICGEDFFIFDSTLSSEKGYMAQQLQELLSTIMTVNPAVAMQFAQRIDPMKVMDEIQYLRGGSTTARFSYDPGQGPVMPPLQALPGQPGTAPAAVAQ